MKSFQSVFIMLIHDGMEQSIKISIFTTHGRVRAGNSEPLVSFVCLFVRLFQLHDGTKDESAKIVDAVQLR